MHTNVGNVSCRYLTILSMTRNQICHKKSNKCLTPAWQFWVSILFVIAVVLNRNTIKPLYIISYCCNDSDNNRHVENATFSTQKDIIPYKQIYASLGNSIDKPWCINSMLYVASFATLSLRLYGHNLISNGIMVRMRMLYGYLATYTIDKRLCLLWNTR